jgi:hypothetical protein
MKEIDIIYPVRDMRVSDCKDLNFSMKCFMENKDYNINFCLYDVGNNKSESKLRDKLDFNFRYGYSKWSLHYGLSRAINLGVKELVKTDTFIISDITTIASENTINEAMKKYEKSNFTIFSLEYPLKKEVSLQTSFKGLMQKGNFLKDSSRRGIFKLLNKEIFYTLGGYEESYLDNEYQVEEKDFILRSVILDGSIKSFYENRVFLIKKFSDKKNKIVEKKEDIYTDKIKKFKELNLLEKSYNAPIINRKRENRKNKLTSEQIHHLYCIETSLK